MGDSCDGRIIVPLCEAGKNPAPQFLGPFGANPRESGNTTNVGKFSFWDPKPYETHEPAAGNPGRINPVACMNVAGPCTFDLDTML